MKFVHKTESNFAEQLQRRIVRVADVTRDKVHTFTRVRHKCLRGAQLCLQMERGHFNHLLIETELLMKLRVAKNFSLYCHSKSIFIMKKHPAICKNISTNQFFGTRLMYFLNIISKFVNTLYKNLMNVENFLLFP